MTTGRDEYEPQVPKRKEKRERGANACSQAWKKRQGVHALLKGPYLTGARPLLWENLPAPSRHLVIWAVSCDFNQVRQQPAGTALKAQTQPHRPGLRRFTKTPAGGTVEQETTSRRSESCFLLQSSLIQHFWNRNNVTEDRRVREGQEKCISTTILPAPPQPPPSERPAHRTDAISLDLLSVTHDSQPST